MNPPSDASARIYTAYNKRDRLFNDESPLFLKSTLFKYEDPAINPPVTSLESDVKRYSRSKSYDDKNIHTKNPMTFNHIDNSYNFQNLPQKSSCLCANKVLTLLNYLLNHCGILQLETDKALESLKVEKESKAKLASQLEESLQREKLLLSEVNKMRELLKNAGLVH